ncbi:hypothetical protein BFP97_03165 [Roseivirga sp. 4D4]|uniref:hypothetical protein n=1 Tax=Roseivirga sp. 4D4 TaxID=1889784 RepID=UPI000853A0A1|nr:hypothetical protein [Roseivirga sp. 4D4]OEK00566.1 hypothetical protein BFP97_03165 [Roseivirga sp. 4D4]
MANITKHRKVICRAITVFSLVVIGIVPVYGQHLDSDITPELTKREVRKLKRQKIEMAKVQANIERMIDLLEQRDLVIIDDGMRSGWSSEPLISNFFRIKGDTLTTQRASGKRTFESISRINKRQGIITKIRTLENSNRVIIEYRDALTLEPRQYSIMVFANRLEVKDDFESRLLIRGKAEKNTDANVFEIGKNSASLMFERRLWSSGRARNGEGLFSDGAAIGW